MAYMENIREKCKENMVMKKSFIWKLLLVIGICPFVLPFLFAGTRMSTWTLADWLIMYSYIYWPTYIIGLVLIVVSVYKLKK